METAKTMNQDEISHEGQQLWERWTAMWNGDLDQANDIIEAGFYVHLTNKKLTDPETLRDAKAIKAWVSSVRHLYKTLVYSTSVGPFIDVAQQTLACHWHATGIYAGLTGTPNDSPGKEFLMAGTDILKFRNGKIYECWTLSNPVS